MVRGKLFSGQDDLTEIKKIREAVFVQEYGVLAEQEWDEQDPYCMHVLAYDGETPVATGRISYDGFEFVISKVAVLKEFRKQFYGDFIVRMLIDKAMMSEAKLVKTEVFAESVPFYETIGFQVIGEGGSLAGHKLCQMELRTDCVHKCCNCK